MHDPNPDKWLARLEDEAMSQPRTAMDDDSDPEMAETPDDYTDRAEDDVLYWDWVRENER